eukprot:TRINITY_DN57146_c0_g1_i1.p1 TRINITY_DN57146_c0_g1~~TRINITY_DN57146_c0_g1_i1.p1  ORF type:complete len:866 (-),score=158.02 TRINITY_DN57146_c0_g1_i1:18-2501(-)
MTDEITASAAKEVSRFSVFDFSEFALVVETCASKELDLIARSFKKHATAVGSGGAPCLCMDRFQGLLHDLNATSSWPSVRESLEAVGFSSLPEDEAPAGPAFCMDLGQVNAALAELRARQGSSLQQLAQAELVFSCEARTVLEGHRAIHVNDLPRILQQLFEEDVYQSASMLCGRIGSQSSCSDSDDDDDDDSEQEEQIDPDGDKPAGFVGVDMNTSSTKRSKHSKDNITFGEFLIWMRRVRCVQLDHLWRRFHAAQEDGTHLHKILAELIPGTSTADEAKCLIAAAVSSGQAVTFNSLIRLVQRHRLTESWCNDDVEYLENMFQLFQHANNSGLITRADCLFLFKAMGYGLSPDETFMLFQDANLKSHRCLSFNKFLLIVRYSRKRELGMIKTAFEMFSEEEAFSDDSDLGSSGDSDDDDGDADDASPCAADASAGFVRTNSAGRRSSAANHSSRAAFRRRSSVLEVPKTATGQIVGLAVPDAVCKALEAMGRSLTASTLEEVLSRLELSGKKALDIQELTALVQMLRQNESENRRQFANWSSAEIRNLQIIFEVAGGRDDKRLNAAALDRLLWNLGIRENFEDLDSLLRRAGAAAGKHDADAVGEGVTLQVLLHLLGFISQENKGQLFDRESDAYFREGCTENDILCFRKLFTKLRSREEELTNSHFKPILPERPSTCRARRDGGVSAPLDVNTDAQIKRRSSLCLELEPTILNSVMSSLAVSAAIPEVSSATVLGFLRRLAKNCGQRFLAVEEIQLWNKLVELGCDRQNDSGTLDYAAFVRVLSWVLRTDFAKIRSQANVAGALSALVDQFESKGLFDGITSEI